MIYMVIQGLDHRMHRGSTVEYKPAKTNCEKPWTPWEIV